jgi:hypothetical protein
MSKPGRNQPCPCGSGKKYKKCHGAYAVDDALRPEIQAGIDQKIREVEALRQRREQQQGLGRPIVAAKMRDHQLVVVGNKMLWSANWRTFHDFLRDFLFNWLGQQWLVTERRKDADERHTIVRWFDQAAEDARLTGSMRGGISVAPMIGASRAFLNLAYNIYLIAHHTGEAGDAIVKGYAGRLKSARADDFSGALFETYAAAAFLKAGFKLEFENERDGLTSHVEFVAVYPATGKKFSVEVKTRERSMASAGTGEDIDDIKRLRVANKLNKALGKNAEHARVVMIEVNVPELVTTSAGWPESAMRQIRENEKSDFPDGGKKPSAYVFVTNHPFHSNLGIADTGMQVLATGFHMADFGLDAGHTSYKAVLESRERHVEMFALMNSMRTHYEIPSTFDGEIPELAFGSDEQLPRLQFGRWYLVPLADGREVPGRLFDAVVIEPEKRAMGCYQLATGEYILAACPLSDAELAAYRRYPDTFFGQVRETTRRWNTLVELCDFFYESHKDTPREKALEWLAGAFDYERLKTLSQKDLAVILCERWALGAMNRDNAKQAS